MPSSQAGSSHVSSLIQVQVLLHQFGLILTVPHLEIVWRTYIKSILASYSQKTGGSSLFRPQHQVDIKNLFCWAYNIPVFFHPSTTNGMICLLRSASFSSFSFCQGWCCHDMTQRRWAKTRLFCGGKNVHVYHQKWLNTQENELFLLACVYIWPN